MKVSTNRFEDRKLFLNKLDTSIFERLLSKYFANVKWNYASQKADSGLNNVSSEQELELKIFRKDIALKCLVFLLKYLFLSLKEYFSSDFYFPHERGNYFLQIEPTIY